LGIPEREQSPVGNDALKFGYQARGVVAEALVPDGERIEADETSEAIREISSARHCRVIHQDWNDPHFLGKSGLDFQPDHIVWVFKAPTTLFVNCGQPIRTYDRKQYGAGLHRARNFLGEVSARPDCIHVNEDPIRSEIVSEAIAQSPGEIVILVPSIADENTVAASSLGLLGPPGLLGLLRPLGLLGPPDLLGQLPKRALN
jgi:hypothetical protein